MNSTNKLSVSQVNITGGFWADRQELNRDVTLDSVREQFENTGRFAAFRFDWQEGIPDRPHIFWDSDVAKWLESAAYVLNKNEDKKLEAYVDNVVDLIEKNQDENGYFNIYFTVCEPDNRFCNRMAHELYCAGHLMEAAVAYDEATGKDKFLKSMCRYADHIEKVFKTDNSAEFSTCGHEEIELALVKLYHCTGEKRYLELSKHFVDIRGTLASKEVQAGENDAYVQDHLPVRKQTTAEGHSVRAGYLFSAMADLSREYADEELFEACDKLFKNITEKRMYITGGIGSTSAGEAFTVDYDLPNASAYAETCAAISLYMFANRMSRNKADSRYADAAERAMYNGIISGISLDGKSFFYENPLEINLFDRKLPQKAKTRFPITQRLEVFGCSCCPPNMTRFIASLGENLYSTNADTVFVHHYMQSEAGFPVGEKTVEIEQKTEYPNEGTVEVRLTGMANKRIAFRIPGWCKQYTLLVNSEIASPEVLNGYAYLPVEEDDIKIILAMDMRPQWLEANGHVCECVGMVALQKGPIVYCAEAVDNGDELWSLRADVCVEVKDTFKPSLHLTALKTEGYRKTDKDSAALYTPVGEGYEPQTIQLIPYYAFANRGESEMRVWLYKF